MSVRGVTLRGEGGIFCAGGDLKMFKTGFQGGEQGLKDVHHASEMTGLFFDMINSYPARLKINYLDKILETSTSICSLIVFAVSGLAVNFITGSIGFPIILP